MTIKKELKSIHKSIVKLQALLNDPQAYHQRLPKHVVTPYPSKEEFALAFNRDLNRLNVALIQFEQFCGDLKINHSVEHLQTCQQQALMIASEFGTKSPSVLGERNVYLRAGAVDIWCDIVNAVNALHASVFDY